MPHVSKGQRRSVQGRLARLRQFLAATSAPDEVRLDLEGLSGDLEASNLGLVFEEHEEPVEQLLLRARATLLENETLRINSGGQINQLIEGENLAVLVHLVSFLTGQVDTVFMDPPYNTGMTELSYSDDRWLDDSDRYPHSKWLSFMEKRLTLARLLLSERGVLFLNVDQHEAGTAMLLCGTIFGESNVDVLIWPKTDPRFDQNRVDKPYIGIKMVHEYIVVCYRNRTLGHLGRVCLPSDATQTGPGVFQDLESIVKGLGTTSSAKDEIGLIFGDRYRFQTPKPMRLVRELLRAASGAGSIVLDCFAGSGTTGHAVMDLNREDGGHRSFILINNNENNICHDVTYERLRIAIASEQYKESLRYFVLGFEEH